MKAQHQLDMLQALDRHFKTGDISVSSAMLASAFSWEHDYTVGILKSLEMIGKIQCESIVETTYALTQEGEEIVQNGSPEVLLARLLPLAVADIKANPVYQRALAYCLKNQWAKKDGETIQPLAMPTEDSVQVALQAVAKQADLSNIDVAGLVKRKLVTKSSRTIFFPRPTDTFSPEIKKQLVDLDKNILLSGEWKTGEFKPYNFNAAGIPPSFGSVHPLMKTRSLFRQILQQMGFEEMDTRRWVENCFWNFDALFQPQTHPVRDAHDTFFLKNPPMSKDVDFQMRQALEQQKVPVENVSKAMHILDRDYFARVKQMHESGDGESLGWECPWDENESYKLILRTHTTCVTSRVLRHLALDYQEQLRELKEANKRQGLPELEGADEIAIDRKFFSIDRVFRNETLDATHLAEFYQVEGIVASNKSSLAELMGIIKTFFAKIGIHDVQFKPAYNPYTEPSMEIFGFHPTLNKWTEIGNSGVFRPEMLKPMGLPEDLVVLGWGLSLERPTMINNNVKDIRELIGPKAKLNVF